MDKIANANKGKRKNRSVGVDLGLKNLLTLSNGVTINHHPSLPRLKYNLKYFMKRLEGQKAGSKRWFETVRVIEKTKREIENCQQDYANKLAASLTRHYHVICVEGEVHGGTISQETENDIYIANWNMLRNTIRKKAKELGVIYIEVAPFFTSQTCSRCGNRMKIPLAQRNYDCPLCGLSLDRDVNAAINIRKKGLAKLNRQRKAQEALGVPPF